MSPLQEKLYWREWGAVHKADPSIDRHELHIAALGEDKSHKHFTNDEFDKVLGQMRAISKPTDLAGQLRQLNQKKTRLVWKISQEQCALLAVVLKSSFDSFSLTVGDQLRAELYIAQIATDQFGGQRNAALQTLLSALAPDQLENLRSTLASRINQLRRKQGLTIHEMRNLACLPCDCKVCTNAGRVSAPIREPSVPF
jgi:hypothetical protein